VETELRKRKMNKGLKGSQQMPSLGEGMGWRRTLEVSPGGVDCRIRGSQVAMSHMEESLRTRKNWSIH